ncbi:MAG: AraC family transcriptional regulator [Anaerocolumna sp.]|jgi:YesN/AraC family two-component response regulator|nr:AraC family transcriptional regulator [Anaerocolumna sp.]
MIESIVNEIMELYTETTKLTTIYMDSSHITYPLSIKGLEFNLLMKYADFDELIHFLDSKFKQITTFTMELNTLHTFYTRNSFVYNIIFIKSSDIIIALIAGPVITDMPDKIAIDETLNNKSLPHYKRNEFSTFLNTIPLVSTERIKQLGKLLLLVSETEIQNPNLILQKIYGRKTYDIDIKKYYVETIKPEYETAELRNFYRFGINLIYKISHGDVNGVKEAIGECANLFMEMRTMEDNNRLLKNICIIIFSIACYSAIQANAPYEPMLYRLSKSLTKIEKLYIPGDIVSYMSTTVESYAHAVSVTADNSNYSLHISRVIQYIKNHYTEKITLKHLAEYIKINPVYLSSLLKKETNMSLSNHINLIRIEESKKLLINTNKSILEIACDVGYNYQNHFNTVFMKYVGQTPLQYRQRRGNRNYEP